MTTETAQSWVPEDNLANRLVLVRRALKMTQREAADAAGLTFGEWQSLEDGRAARGLDVKVARISAALRVDRDWLMWGGPLTNAGGPPPGIRAAGGGTYFVAPAEGLEPSTCRLTALPTVPVEGDVDPECYPAAA